jgi:hypothetical protein
MNACCKDITKNKFKQEPYVTRGETAYAASGAIPEVPTPPLSFRSASQ